MTQALLDVLCSTTTITTSTKTSSSSSSSSSSSFASKNEQQQTALQASSEFRQSTLSGPVYHIESHTHATTGRGKGCAWVYVRSVEDIQTIVDALNNRTFCCVNPESGEVGFIPFPAQVPDDEIERVFQFDHDHRQRSVHYLLHRGRVTAEMPQSMKKDVIAKLCERAMLKTFPPLPIISAQCSHLTPPPPPPTSDLPLHIRPPRQHEALANVVTSKNPVSVPVPVIPVGFDAPRHQPQQQQQQQSAVEHDAGALLNNNIPPIVMLQDEGHGVIELKEPEVCHISRSKDDPITTFLPKLRRISSDMGDFTTSPSSSVGSALENNHANSSTTSSIIKCFCHQGRRYHWNPY